MSKERYGAFFDRGREGFQLCVVPLFSVFSWFIFLLVGGIIVYGIAFALILSFVNSSFYYRDVRAEWGQVINLFKISGENAALIEGNQ